MQNIPINSFFFEGESIPVYDWKENENWPRLTVITPSFNQAAYLEETIQSVFLQGYPNLEYLVFDGGSTDDSINVIRKYERWIDYWVSEPDKGQSHAINKGIEQATGDWIAWLNSDDYYLPLAFAHVMGYACDHPDANWIVGTTVFVNQAGKTNHEFKADLRTGRWQVTDRVTNTWLDFICTKWSGTGLPQPSSFWSREALLKVGGLDESLRYAMDHELYGRLAYEGYMPSILSKRIAAFRLHQRQKTAEGMEMFLEEELFVVDNWLKRTVGKEHDFLKEYQKWLPSYDFNQSFDNKLIGALRSIIGKVKFG